MDGIGINGGGQARRGEPVDMERVVLEPDCMDAVAETTASNFRQWLEAPTDGGPRMPDAWRLDDGSLLVQAADGNEAVVPAGGWRMATEEEMEHGRNLQEAGMEELRKAREELEAARRDAERATGPDLDLEERLATDAFASLFEGAEVRVAVLSRDDSGLSIADTLTGSGAELSRRVADWKASSDGFMVVATAPGRSAWFYGTAKHRREFEGRVLAELFGRYLHGTKECELTVSPSEDVAWVGQAVGRMTRTMTADSGGLPS